MPIFQAKNLADMTTHTKYTALPEHSRCRILVCDATAMGALRLTSLLEHMGYTDITSVNEHRDVIPSLFNPLPFDLLVLDLRMPQLTGLKIIYLIRRKYSASQLPILTITEGGAPEICNAALLAGANDNLFKPLDPITTALRVRNLLTIRDLYKSSEDIRNNLEREVTARTAKLNLLIENGLLMSMTHDRAKLIEHTLFEGRRLLHCDAATLYLVTERNTLRFGLRTRTDDLIECEIPLDDPATGEADGHHVCTWCVQHKETVCIDDVYQETRFDVSGARRFDDFSGYRTVSMLTVPMTPRNGAVVGVLQFINKLDPVTHAVIAFPPDLVKLVEALAAQAAVTLENLALSDARLAQNEASHQLANQLAHLDRQLSLCNLSASLGHELNQPLTAILTNTQVARRGLQTGLFDTARVVEFLDRIEHNTKRASAIIERIRNFVGPSVLHHEIVNLNRAVQEVAELVVEKTRSSQVVLKLPEAEPALLVRGDPIQISQIILNAFRNAIEALEHVDHRVIQVTLLRQSGRVRLQIRDTGPGLTPEALAQVGQPFFTTKAAGMGMGFSISRTLAEQHEGTLTIGNADGGGACVELVLPALTAAVTDQPPP